MQMKNSFYNDIVESKRSAVTTREKRGSNLDPLKWVKFVFVLH